MDKQGAKANETGKDFENKIEGLLKSFGFGSNDARVLERQASYHSTLKKAKARMDFRITYGSKRKTVAIECRHQEVAGSVDEKLPYLLYNSVKSLTDDLIILLIDGGGAREGIVDFIKTEAAQVKDKTVLVLDYTEFEKWCHVEFDEDTGGQTL